MAEIKDKFGVLTNVDDHAPWAVKLSHEAQMLSGALTEGLLDKTGDSWKEFVESPANRLATGALSLWVVTRATEAFLNRYQKAAKLILNLGGLAYTGVTALDLAHDKQRLDTMKRAWDHTWLNGKNIDHSVNLAKKEISRTALDGTGMFLGIAPVGFEAASRLSFLKRCKLDPTGCTKKADELLAKGDFGKASGMYSDILAFATKANPNDHLRAGELNSKLAQCKFMEFDHAKGLSQIERKLLHADKLETQAMAYHKDAIKNFRLAGKQNSQLMDVTDTLIETGNWYKDVNRFKEAKQALGAALWMRARHFPKSDGMATATVMEHIGDVYDAEKIHDRADLCYKRVMKIIEAKHGPRDFRLIKPLEMRGGYAYQNANFAEAEDHLKRALVLKREKYPAGDPKIGEHIPCLADVLRSLGGETKLREARALYWEGAVQGKSYQYGPTEQARIAGGITACSQALKPFVEARAAKAVELATTLEAKGLTAEAQMAANEANWLAEEAALTEAQAKGLPWLVYAEKPEMELMARRLAPKESFNLDLGN